MQIRCQRSTRFAAAFARWVSVRCATTGTIRLAPSSTHFSIAHSMRSNLKMERSNGQVGLGSGGNDFAQFEFDPAVGDADDATAADAFDSCDVEFLPDACAKHVSKMLGVRTDQSGAIPGDFIGDPAAAGHDRVILMLSS